MHDHDHDHDLHPEDPADPTSDTHDEPPACLCYMAGHNNHFIQGCHCLEAPNFWTVATPLEEPGWMSVTLEEGELRLWTHSPELIAELCPRPTECDYVPKYSCLLFPTPESGRRLLSVARKQTPCVFSPPPDDPFGALLTHGGFSLPGRRALELLGDETAG